MSKESFEEMAARLKNTLGDIKRYSEIKEAQVYKLLEKIDALEQQLKEAREVIEAAYNIDAKYYDDPKVTYRDYHNSVTELLEQFLEKYKEVNNE